MKICFPIQNDEGIESKVYNHFGSAPLFAIVDTETQGVILINNQDRHHAKGGCNPLKALDNQEVGAVIVGGIGGGALTKLNQSGIKVYRAQSETVKENLALFASQNLPEFVLQTCCNGHGHGGACAH